VAERFGIDAVPVADEETRSVVPRPRLTELLGGPDGGRVRGDVDVNDPSTVMGQDDEHEEHAERGGGEVKKSIDVSWEMWLVRNVRQLWDRDLGGRRPRCFATVAWEISIPSFRSSP
jgi:hypothetical protein